MKEAASLLAVSQKNTPPILLFGVRGDKNRTLVLARSQVNLIRTMKREHSRKPDEMVDLIERCSAGPYLELFARGDREGWAMWGNQADAKYKNHTVCNEETVNSKEKI